MNKEKFFPDNQILDFLQTNEIINLSDVEEKMKQQNNAKFLRHHDNKIWKGSDGRYRTYLPDDKLPSGRKLIVKSSKDDLEEEVIRFYRDSSSTSSQVHTLRSLYPEWLEYKSLHTTASTYITRIKSDWNKYYENSKLVDIPLNKLDKIILDEFVHRLILENELTKRAYYNCSIILRQSLQYALEKGYIAKNHFSMVKVDGKRMFRKEKKKSDSSEVYTNRQQEILAELAWKEFYDRKLQCQLSPLAVLFSFQTGLRIGELLALKYSDIEDEAGNTIHIQRMVRHQTHEVVSHTKTDYSDRSVFLTSEAKRIIETAKKRQLEELGFVGEYIFSLTEKPLNYYSVARCLRRYCKAMGIDMKSSHKIRKTFISSLIDGQVNLNTVRTLAGHADERTTLKNYCYDRSTEIEKIQQIELALQ